MERNALFKLLAVVLMAVMALSGIGVSVFKGQMVAAWQVHRRLLEGVGLKFSPQAHTRAQSRYL